jgi:hypothetical protein
MEGWQGSDGFVSMGDLGKEGFGLLGMGEGLQ